MAGLVDSEPDHARPPPGALARRLIRAADRAALATSSTGDGWPHASLVVVACDHDASPVLLISALARHTRNLAADPRASLLFDDTAGRADPLTGARLTALGRIEPIESDRLKARYLARHPGAACYAGFADFRLWRMRIERALLVAGFGAIIELAADAVLFDTTGCAALAAAEPDIADRMNADHGEALALYAVALAGRTPGAWRMTGIDPEGCDLRLAGETVRLDFDRPVTDPGSARAALAALAARARSLAAR